MLVSEIVDRAWSEFLYPGGANLPAFDTLASDITAVSSSLTASGLQSYIGQSVIEFDDSSYELALTKESESSTAIDLNERGWLDTTAASHTSGTKFWIEPEFPKQTILNALKSVVGTLYPLGLYYRAAVTNITSSTASTAFDSDVKDVISVLYRDGSTRWTKARKGMHYEVFKQTSPIEIQFWLAPTTTSTTRIIVKKDFTIPTSVSQDISGDCHVPATLAPYLPMAVAGYVLQGKESSFVVPDDLVRKLEREGIQAGTAMQVGSALINRFETHYVALERVRLREQDPVSVTYRS